MTFPMLDLEEQIAEASRWAFAAQNTIDEMFEPDPPQPIFAEYLEKLKQAERLLDSILKDEEFRKMYEADRNAYNAQPD